MSTDKSTSNWFKYLTEATYAIDVEGHADSEEGAIIDKIGDTRKVAPHDQEGRTAKQQLFNTIENAQEVMDNLHDDDELEAWIQSKLTKISSMMSAVNHYLKYEYRKEEIPEKGLE